MKSKILYISHLVDTEGPLNETPQGTVERLNEIYGLNIKPTKENFKRIINGKIKFKGFEKTVKRILENRRVKTNRNWKELTKMLNRITSNNFRSKFKDNFNNKWIYNWCCLNHAGFTGKNPRFRDLGYTKIYSKYYKYLESNNSNTKDRIGMHYHSNSITNDAHRAGSTFLNSSNIYEILCRLVIDYKWFPSFFRAGHNTVRPDLNFFLEQWIPFDFSNTSIKKISFNNIKSTARFGNWSKSSKSWIPYNPSHSDYQLKGDQNRLVARCLPMDEREYSLKLKDIENAFKEARNKRKAYLCFTNHDFRDMEPDVKKIYKLILEAKKKYPEVKFKFVNALDGFRKFKKFKGQIKAKVKLKKKDHYYMLYVNAKNIFGCQPFLAIKTRKKKYYWQNFDFEKKNLWSYSFDHDNILIDKVEKIGLALTDTHGKTKIYNIDPKKKMIKSFNVNQ